VALGCIACHSGEANPVSNRDDVYSQPEFQELSIGCENCHGPGSMHVAERRENKPLPSGGDDSIVNPADLPGWLADNICMSCHEQGDAQALVRGKSYLDFRPGRPLSETMALFKVPEKDKSEGKGVPLEHYTLMISSQCYRSSGGRLSCLTCHDPHLQPSPVEAPAYYRAKCLSCHTDASCKLPLAERQQQTLPDNCIGCHMPKQPLGLIAHSALTNHRIIRDAYEPFPKGVLDRQAAGPDGLIYLDAPRDGSSSVPLPRSLLVAYQQLLGEHPEFQSRFDHLLDRAAKADPQDPQILAMLARRQLEAGGMNAAPQVISLLYRAIERGSTWASDYLLLGDLLGRTDHPAEAVNILDRGLALGPYVKNFYELLAQDEDLLGNKNRERAVLELGVRRFPEDKQMRDHLKKLEPSGHS
jgi:hypothetical protein